MTKTLDDRIADSFAATLPSKDIAALLAEVTEADRAAKAASEEANKIALDPATRPDAVAAARRAAEDADFGRRRLERATEALTQQHQDAIARERAEAQRKELAAATTERDELAKDLVEYLDLSRRIVVLLSRLQASNARIGENSSAEIIARQAGASWPVNVDVTLPKLLTGVKLPKFRRDGSNNGYVWPPQ
jgi:hypothetical protein